MPPGKRKKRSVVHSSSVALLSLLKIAMDLDQDTNHPCQVDKLCKAVGVNVRSNSASRSQRNPMVLQMGTFDKVLWRLVGQL